LLQSRRRGHFIFAENTAKRGFLLSAQGLHIYAVALFSQAIVTREFSTEEIE